nr:uncharacterized protein LOC111990031 isoform X2 [Quercus suber]
MIEVSLQSWVREMMMEVLQQCVFLIPRRGFSKKLKNQIGWSSRKEVCLMPADDESTAFFISIMMNIIIWNCIGALKPSLQSSVCDLVANHDPTMIVVMETRIGNDKAQDITDRLPFQGALYTDSIDFAGGLWLLWDPDRVEVTYLTSTQQEIHTFVNLRSVLRLHSSNGAF